MNIYQIESEIKDLLDNSVNQETGELTDEAVKQLDFLSKNRAEKQKNIILYVKNLQGEAAIIQAEINRLGELQAAVTRKEESLKKMLAESMTLNNEKELDFQICKAKFKLNPPRLEIEKGANLSTFTKCEMVEKIDKEGIKKALKAGEKIDGCSLVQGQRLEIL